MPSFYYIFEGASESRLRLVSDQIRGDGDAEVMRCAGQGFVWVGDAPEHYGPAWDESSGVQLVSAGRLVWPQSAWAQARELPFKGGVANRPLLARYLKSGPSGVAPYNGAAAVVISDPRDKSLHLWTDQFGYHPCFLYKEDDFQQCIITTFPDALLGDPNVSVTQDRASMADFLRAWRITPPHTYYREVKYAGAATYRCWTVQKSNLVHNNYWNPLDSEFYEDISLAAERLANAVKVSIQERTAAANRPAFFVSGGADSRVLLFAASNPSKVVGINLYERPTRESAIAKKLCELAGAKYIGFQRDNDFYPRLLHENVRWSGAMWSTEDSHYLGVRHIINQVQADLVMTACTTDWVFKGYGLEKAYRRFMGRDLPFNKYMSVRVDGFLPNFPLPAPAEYKREIDERVQYWFAGCPTQLKSERDRFLVEDRRVRPACYTVSVSGQMMYRVFPYDTFLADSRIAECYSRIPPRWKLNGEVWGKVAARVCAEAVNVVNANFGWRVDAGPAHKLIAFSKGWIGRRLERRSALVQDDGHPPSDGSWPELGWYAVHSTTLQEFWHSVPQDDRLLMESIGGQDPWKRPLNQWARDPNYLFRMLTLLAHWKISRERRRARAHV